MSVVLITGCSSGFGLLAVEQLAARGDHIFATMRNPEARTALRPKNCVRWPRQAQGMSMCLVST